MKRSYFFIVVIIAFGLIILGCEKSEPLSPELEAVGLGNSLAKATSTPVQGTLYLTPAGPWQERYTTPGGTEHIRGWPLKVTFPEGEGDFVGEGLFIQNSDWKLPQYTGSASGPFTATVTWQGKTGTFTGQFAGSVHEFYISAKFVCQGSDDFEGLKWDATIDGYLGGPYTYGGRVLDPKGE